MCEENAAEIEQTDSTPDISSAGIRLSDGSTYYNVDGNSIIEISPPPSPW